MSSLVEPMIIMPPAITRTSEFYSMDKKLYDKYAPSLKEEDYNDASQ